MMKSKKENKDNINTQNRFLTACVCSILLLLTLCYFGVNSNFKGTSAVVEGSCPSSAPNIVFDAVSGEDYCCPEGDYKVADVNGIKYCYNLSDKGYIGLVNGQVSCVDYGEKVFASLGTDWPGDDLCAGIFDGYWKVNIVAETNTEDCEVVSPIPGAMTFGCTCNAPLSSCGVIATKRVEYSCYYCSQVDEYIWSAGGNISTSDCMETTIDVSDESQCNNLNNTEYTVSFNAGTGELYSDGKLDEKAESKCSPNSIDGSCKVSVPEVVSSNGKSFIGWTDSGSCSDAKMIDSEVSVTENKTYTACWSDEPFMLYNSSNSVFEVEAYQTIDKIYLSISLDMYESDFDINPKCVSSDESILKCQFEDDVFEEDQDTIELVINRYKKGTAFIKVYNYSDGLEISDINDGYVSIMVTDGSSIELETYTVTYNANAGTEFVYNMPSSPVTKTQGQNLRLNTTVPTRSGYTFEEWNTKPDGSGIGYQPGGYYDKDADVTLYAQWTKNAVTKYTVTYNANGGTVSPLSQTVDSETSVTLPTPTRDGYTFNGWFTSSTGGTEVGDAGATYTVKSNVTLYAQWTQNSTAVTNSVIFKSDGIQVGRATCIAPKAGSGCTINEYSVPGVTKTGYTLVGWNHPDLGSKCVSSKEIVTYIDGAVYTACWEANKYTVSYNANGGSNAPSAQTKEHNVILVLSSRVPTRDGYKFKGWGKTSNATYASFAAGGVYSSNESITLYAVWEKESSVEITNTAQIPTSSLCRTNLVYNGFQQQLVSSTSVTGYVLADVNQTHVGDYTVTAILLEGYKWSDNTTGTKSFTCSIKKATPSLTIEKSSITINVGESYEIGYSSNSDSSKYSCSSLNSNIAFCNIASGKLVITGKSVGETKVTLKVLASDNYNDVAKEITVKVVNSATPTPESKTFTAIFNANGGTLNGSSSQSCTTTGANCEITSLPTATKAGHTFKGWGLSSTCSSGSTSKLTLDKSATYYACFVKDKTPAVDNDGNTTGNPTTGDITIALVWFGGMLAIGYAAWYFKRSKEN